MRTNGRLTFTALTAAALAVSGAAVSTAGPGGPEGAPSAEKQPDFPPFDKVSEGLTKVVSTADGEASLYDLYASKEDGRLLASLPRNYESQLIMMACTVSGGDPQAGVMGPTHYAKWRKIGKQLALVAPDFFARTDGDKQAKDSMAQLYTGTVILSLPIVAMGPTGGPVIDLGFMGTQLAGKLFGDSEWGAYGPAVRKLDASLATLTKAKAFPENIIFEYEAPNETGRLVRLTYAIGQLDGTPGYKPRKADPRVGYFYNWSQDFARPANQDVTERYITRWNVEKADPSLAMSPPKEPIVWYIEHTTPVKFRRYVREGILMWNDAFREIGIDGALEVYQQDSATGAHMDIDPEDARYNFFRWNASNQGYAIGPSRTNPETGEILDADVVWHQGLTRSVRTMLENLSDEITLRGFGPETLAFFDEHPEWDPRVRLASPEKREQMIRRAEMRAAEAVHTELTHHDHPWTQGAGDPMNAACRIGPMLAMDFSLADAALAAQVLETGDDSDATLLDGLPEEFIGGMIRYISAHEVGHCIGLQHNMTASTIRTLRDINSPGYDGPTIGSVMDYVAANINHKLGEAQGPYATPCVGPYDKWAIAFGYGPEDKVEETLARVGEPDHIFVTQMQMSFGQDPRNMTWDMGADNLKFAESRLALVQELRAKLIENIVDEGDSWAEARRRYQALMGTHVQSVYIASRWVGGSFVNNDFKGDPGDRAPIEDVPAATQRRALKLVMDNAFEDEAFGLTPQLVRYFGKQDWWDPAGISELTSDTSYTVHDLVGGVQAAGLTFLMNPTTLRRVYDNEYRAGDDAITMAEIVRAVSDNVWREYAGGRASEVSSFRRNLQREHIDRLITLALLDSSSSPSLRTISTLAKQELTRIDSMTGKAQGSGDPYLAAHLADIKARIAKAQEASYVLTR